ncbi:MAG: hypothetical protein IT385_19325 [Deltaproteobacteria bacterium]|nr:hypothetical protein [Deltaproteobacteria bacterium]
MMRRPALLILSAALACDDDAGSEPAYVPPVPSFPAADDPRPFVLSEVGLFHEGAPAPDLITFEPTYALWSDGLEKRRWLRLPEGATLDTRDPDHWQLPVGAILFKDFALRAPGEANARSLETRVIARTGPGPMDYWMGAFVWRADGSDADFARAGVVDVAGSDHDVPSAERCWSCHIGTPGRVLGLGVVQLAADKPGAVTLDELAPRLSDAVPTPALDVDAEAREALGYLHGNCAHCHSPTGVARPDTDLDLSWSVADLDLADTGAWRTAVGIATRSWIRPEAPLRIAPGEPDRSAVVVRMRARGTTDQMPPLATEHVDEAGLVILTTWIASLGAP